MQRKGQGLSLNVIIVAALALIVLVVLIVVFTGRIGQFEEGVGRESQTELVKLRIGYGQCQPSASAEAAFSSAFGSAETLDDKEFARADFRDVIDECKTYSDDRAVCESNGCSWK